MRFLETSAAPVPGQMVAEPPTPGLGGVQRDQPQCPAVLLRTSSLSLKPPLDQPAEALCLPAPALWAVGGQQEAEGLWEQGPAALGSGLLPAALQPLPAAQQLPAPGVLRAVTLPLPHVWRPTPPEQRAEGQQPALQAPWPAPPGCPSPDAAAAGSQAAGDETLEAQQRRSKLLHKYWRLQLQAACEASGAAVVAAPVAPSLAFAAGRAAGAALRPTAAHNADPASTPSKRSWEALVNPRSAQLPAIQPGCRVAGPTNVAGSPTTQASGAFGGGPVARANSGESFGSLGAAPGLPPSPFGLVAVAQPGGAAPAVPTSPTAALEVSNRWASPKRCWPGAHARAAPIAVAAVRGTPTALP